MKPMKQTACAVFLALLSATAPVLGHGSEEAHGAALGKPGDADRISRSIAVEVNDSMRFVPAAIAVKRGETVRFLVTNSGQLKHEMILGSIVALKEHAALMRKFPDMEHADPNQVVVQPGATGILIWQFTRSGHVDFACLQPGHFEAGMKGRVAIK